MKYKIGVALLLVTSFILSGCKKEETPEDPKMTHEYIYYRDGREEEVANPSIAAKIKDGICVSILPTEWMGFYDDYNMYSDIRLYYKYGVENTKPVSISLTWNDSLECEDYSINLSTNKDMSNATVFSSINEKTLELKDLFAGTHYYYQISANFEDKTIVSKRFDFFTSDFIRTIDVDGVQNARDIGNKKTEDGKKRVKQGLVFRSANFDAVTSSGKVDALEKYGIKTDLDLREPGPTSSPLGEGVKYINNAIQLKGSPQYFSEDNGVNSVAYQSTMLNNLKVFADKDSYPIAFHCAIGRDRTGTLAITLYLLLGIDVEQIQQDYIVSFFSSACNRDSFENCGEQMETLIYYFSSYKGKDGVSSGTIYERTAEYATDIGLSTDELNRIRNNLLENC